MRPRYCGRLGRSKDWSVLKIEMRAKVEKLLNLKNQDRQNARTLMYYFTYILECKDGSLYIGSTNNLEERIKQHNSLKSGAHYTKIRRPVVLKYFEKFKSLAKARKREAEIKKWKKIKKINLINNVKWKMLFK